MIAWLLDPGSWLGAAGILARLGEHLGYSALSLVLAVAIGLPLGLWVGHTGRGAAMVVGIANALRAVPTLGLLILGYLLLAAVLPGDLAYSAPSIVVLVILAIPPVLANTYAGVAGVDAQTVEAGYGMGMTGREVVWQVELPAAMPLIMAGVRTAAMQIIATATVAAYVSLGGLGRFLIDGIAQQDYPQVLGGAVLVAALALAAEGILLLLQRALVSPGLRRGKEAAA